MAPFVRYGIWGVGVSVFLDQVGPMLSDAQFTWGERRIMGLVALITVVGFGLGGWIAGRLLKAFAEVIEVLVDGADATWRTADLLELRLIPTLGRIANALEVTELGSATNQGSGHSPSKVRKAIADHHWDEAERLIENLASTSHPLSVSEASSLGHELADARAQVIETLRAELESGRTANDPDRVIDARDALTMHLRGEQLVDLDRQLVRWLTALLRDWIRSGRRARDVALLAARVAETFGDTAEGARLRAALPNLRRTAGLCARCARPFQGKEEVCPRCVDQGASGAPLTPTGVGSSLPKDPT